MSDTGAVERAARALSGWSDDLLDAEDGPNQTAYDIAREVLAAAAPTVEQVAELLAAHTVRGVKDGLWHCECGMYWPLEGDSVEPYMRHLARVLDGAGLLVTPEHDAQWGAR